MHTAASISPFSANLKLMTPSELFAQAIAEEFPHAFTQHQAMAASRIGTFLADPRDNQAFILRGYAGTGKTSLVAAVVRVWQRLGRPVVLLAPTGRAAKVLSMHAGIPAFTIHKIIYRQETFKGEDTRFDRGWNPAKEALFIVDEASMIPSDRSAPSWSGSFAEGGGGVPIFGQGNLLEDLIHFVYSGRNCRMMFVGDTAQLPPVGDNESPALRPSALKTYGLDVTGAQLTEVVRQDSISPVLREATKLRQRIADLSDPRSATRQQMVTQPLGTASSAGQPSPLADYATIDISGESLQVTPGSELIDALETSYRNWGTEQTIVVTRSNKRANIFNNGIRARIFDREDILTRGDLVMAVKNNYHWTAEAQAELPKGEQLPMVFIANGDSAEVVRFRNVHEMHGFTFADATLRFFDYDDLELDCRILIDTLNSESPSLTREEQQRLFQSVLLDYADIKNERERMKAVRKDPYYNALQIKYAYAVTCHKAQGGQWHEVFVDQGYLPDDLDPISYLRWLYTAFTRTSENLYLVNWPKNQTE